MRYALFFAPPTTSPLWLQGCRWLGRDAVSGVFLSQPAFRGLDGETIADLTRTPARYGFHATMMAPFRLKESLQEQDLFEAVESFTAGQRQFTIPPLTVSQLDNFFCLRPIRHSAALQGLSSLCTRAFDRFRAPLKPSELARRKAVQLSGQEKKNLELWGYPYVFEQYRFHFTLTSRIAGGKTKDRVHSGLLDLFEPLLDEPLLIDALCLFVEPNPGQPLRCLHRFSLTPQTPKSEERVAHDQQLLRQNFYPGYQCHSS